MSESRKIYKNTKHRILMLYEKKELMKLQAIKIYLDDKINKLENENKENKNEG